MSQPTSGSNTPTGDWHLIDVLNSVEVRQISDDLFELKTHNGIRSLTAEEFDRYRNDES